MSRAQSHVVGVVLLLAMTAVAMGGLTATVGSIVEDQTSSADAARVASDFESALRPVETTGHRRGTVTFTGGQVDVEERELRILDGSGVIETVQTDALVFEAADRRVGWVGGAIARGRDDAAWLESEPPITSGPDVLVIGAPRLNGSGSVGGTAASSIPLETNVSHSRVDLGRGNYRVAIETKTPAAFDRYAEGRDATTTVADLDGDGVRSVVVDFDGSREAYLVVHDMRLEVGHG